MDFEKVLLSRKSCRKFTDKPVEEEKLEKVVVSASLAPLGLPKMCTPVLTVVTDKDALAGLKGIYDAPAVIIVSCPPSPAPGIGDQNAGCVVEMMALMATSLGLPITRRSLLPRQICWASSSFWIGIWRKKHI